MNKEIKIKTLRELLDSKKIQENPSLLEGRSFSDFTDERKEKGLEAYDQTVYTINKIWKEGDKIMANYEECDFGMYGMADDHRNRDLNAWPYLLDCIELIEGVNASKVCPMAIGPSI